MRKNSSSIRICALFQCDIIPADNRLKPQNLRFESSVVLSSSKTDWVSEDLLLPFESSVVLSSSKTFMQVSDSTHVFESSVVLSSSKTPPRASWLDPQFESSVVLSSSKTGIPGFLV